MKALFWDRKLGWLVALWLLKVAFGLLKVAFWFFGKLFWRFILDHTTSNGRRFFRVVIIILNDIATTSAPHLHLSLRQRLNHMGVSLFSG